MSDDLVQRLRESVRACRALDRSALLAEAADEIERLRVERETRRRTHLTLTEGERTAIVWCVEMAETTATDCDEELAALRFLLERTK